MTDRAATMAGATQAVTMSADRAPMMNVPTYVPPFCSLLTFVSRVWSALGSCRVYAPNIANASATNSNANVIRIHGCWNDAWGAVLNSAAKIAPAAAYVSAMPCTYVNASEKPRIGV